jgi:4-hydroxybenzoate polyprenyltransferase
LILGGKIHSGEAWGANLLGFVALGILASAMYLVNDLCDLRFDRQHWSKQDRPLARGDLLPGHALVAIVIGVALSLLIAAAISRGAVWMLVAYGVLSFAYSVQLKRWPILDVFAVACLMTFRIALGIALSQVTPSPWLIVFSMFIFTSLSLVKRHVELGRNGTRGRATVNGRGYVAEDGPLVFGLGLSAAASAILIMILYLINEAFTAGFYQSPSLLWAMPAILFLWLGRIWLLAGRNEIDDDPIWFAVRDGVSLLLGAAMVVVFLGAWQL